MQPTDIDSGIILKMKKIFTSNKTISQIEDDVVMVTFSGDEGGIPEDFIILSKTKFPEEDENLGPYIECSFGPKGYNLITKTEVYKDKVKIKILDDTFDCIEIFLADTSGLKIKDQIHGILGRCY